MSTIVTRAGKGSILTNTEMDSNFTNLNTDKIQVSTITGTAGKTPAVDADVFPIVDSVGGALNKITWANIKATLASTFAALAGSVSQAFSAASIELGHATDTTLTRVSAGVAAVEGKTIAMLSAVQAWTKAQIGTPVALSVAANAVAVDLSLGNNFTLTLQATTAQTLSNPTNAVAGQKGSIYITQNATPSTLAFGANWLNASATAADSVSTTAGARNVLSYDVFDSTHIYYTIAKHGVA